MASSRALTLDSQPTTNGVIIYGKITTSRIGIIGKRLVSDFSLEVSIYGFLEQTAGETGLNVDTASAPGPRRLACLFQQRQTDLLRKHHLPGHKELPDFLIRR